MVKSNKNTSKLHELTGSIKKNDATIIAQNQYGAFLMFESVVAMPTLSVIPVDYSAPQITDAHIHPSAETHLQHGTDAHILSMRASPVLYLSAGNTLPPPKN
jgi:hypothetical protein